MNITVINGPNLNLLGKREKDIYGNMGFDEYLVLLQKKFKQVNFKYLQSNIEGELINHIQTEGFAADGIILNPGAYGHTSIGIADAVAAIKTPVIEVHISNIFAREDYRHISYVGKNCIGSISGFGLQSYELAVKYYLDKS
ncbi:MAG: 3-dehydroquinate dehydratase [Sphingobacteriaceae bacterium]|nr:3-dehydroquinate dehydratase [Sphingobacteriaceae bacterium]